MLVKEPQSSPISVGPDLFKFSLSSVLNELAKNFSPEAKQMVLLFDPHQRQLNHIIVFVTFKRAAANYLLAHQYYDAILALVRHKVVNLGQANFRQDIHHYLCQFYQP